MRRLDLPAPQRIERRGQVVLDEAFCEPGLRACLGGVHAGELAQLPRRGLSAATRRQLAQRSQVLPFDTGPQSHQAHDPILQSTVAQRREIDTGDAAACRVEICRCRTASLNAIGIDAGNAIVRRFDPAGPMDSIAGRADRVRSRCAVADAMPRKVDEHAPSIHMFAFVCKHSYAYISRNRRQLPPQARDTTGSPALEAAKRPNASYKRAQQQRRTPNTATATRPRRERTFIMSAKSHETTHRAGHLERKQRSLLVVIAQLTCPRVWRTRRAAGPTSHSARIPRFLLSVRSPSAHRRKLSMFNPLRDIVRTANRCPPVAASRPR